MKKFYIVPLKFIDIYRSNNGNGAVESNIHYDFLYQDTIETHKSNACSSQNDKFRFSNYWPKRKNVVCLVWNAIKSEMGNSSQKIEVVKWLYILQGLNDG